MAIYTIGHSTRTEEEFLSLLHKNEIALLADVRFIPKSRKFPQFNEENMPIWLGEADIAYTQIPELGGRRPKAMFESPNTAWQNASFRNYSDYALTEPFEVGLDALLKYASRKRTAICCSEAVYWRCHRSIVADYLTVRGHEVMHILGETSVRRHELRSFAHPAAEGKVHYYE